MVLAYPLRTRDSQAGFSLCSKPTFARDCEPGNIHAQGIRGKLIDQTTWSVVNSDKNDLEIVFKDGELIKDFTLNEIREKIKQQ